MAKKKKTKIVCKEYEAEVCEPKNNKIVCKKKKTRLCTSK